MEEGNASAGVIEFKNKDYYVDQTIAEMLRIAGDVSLLVLADRKQLLHLHIIGLAANYKTGTVKIIKMEIDCIGETSIIKEVNEVVPFSEAFNIMLHIIELT